MSIAACVAAMQTSGPQSETTNLPGAEYLVFALIAVVLALIVLIFIRASARRSSKP
jgi:hypothetical protein